MDMGLKDKVAVITGGSVGIGLAVAHGLAAEGAQVVIAARDGDRAAERAREVAAAHGTRAIAIAADVAHRRGLRAADRRGRARPSAAATS